MAAEMGELIKAPGGYFAFQQNTPLALQRYLVAARAATKYRSFNFHQDAPSSTRRMIFPAFAKMHSQVVRLTQHTSC